MRPAWSTGACDALNALAPVEVDPWIRRGMSLFGLGSLIPAAFMAVDQVPHQAWWFHTVFGGGLVLVTLGLVFISATPRVTMGLAWAYVILVAGGVALWPLAWLGPEVAEATPWIWMCLGAASVSTALLAGARWGFVNAIVVGAMFTVVRLTPSGGEISPLQAMQDLLLLVIIPSTVIIAISILIDSLKDLSLSLEASRRQQAKAAVEAALVEERRRLDSIIHDEVMTTLVAAAQATQLPDAQVATIARHALQQLTAAGEATGDRTPVTLEHLGWLIHDVVSTLCPGLEFSNVATDPSLQVPHAVASAVGQACREVATNIDRHAAAERVRVSLADPSGGKPGFQVTLADDGSGFDPRAVPDDRFGLQLSVHERVQSVGGEVQVRSRPGEGTVVVIEWLAPAPARASAPHPRSRSQRDARSDSFPSLPAVPQHTLVGLIWVLIVLHLILGLTSLDVVTQPWPVLASLVLALIATGLAVSRLDVNPMPVGRARAVVVLTVAITLLTQSVLPYGVWPGYATWHSSVVMALMVVVLFRGHRTTAWFGVGLFVLASAEWAFTRGLGVSEFLKVSFGPVVWTLLAQLINAWLRDVNAQVTTHQASSRAASRAIAQSYSRLVLRDSWLRQLTRQVGPLLQILADPTATVTARDREACAALERRLRDGLRANNLLSEATLDLVEVARDRGVDVRLVNSRGSALPETVRRAVERLMQDSLADHALTRLVARAAPEGYAEVATILALRVDGSSELISLDESGATTKRQEVGGRAEREAPR
ncbi:MAG: ATP-binding protein [Propionicimonas sp.]